MNVYQVLEEALKSTGKEYVEGGPYCGREESYFVYNEVEEQPDRHADDEPAADRFFYQVHYFCPLPRDGEDDSREITERVKKALRDRDFDVTSVQRGQDDKRHVVILCEFLI